MITPDQLKIRQAYDLETKIMLTKQRIHQWYELNAGNVYVAFSGGKDSTVLLHLVRSLYPDVPAVFNNTGCEFPEILKFVRQTENVVYLRPKLTLNKFLINMVIRLFQKRFQEPYLILDTQLIIKKIKCYMALLVEMENQ